MVDMNLYFYLWFFLNQRSHHVTGGHHDFHHHHLLGSPQILRTTFSTMPELRSVLTLVPATITEALAIVNV